jgi:hypothetical protein
LRINIFPYGINIYPSWEKILRRTYLKYLSSREKYLSSRDNYLSPRD